MMNISKLLVAIIAALGAFALTADPNVAYTENATVADALVLDGEYIIDVVSGVTVTYTGEISGTGPLRKTGAGTLVLNNGKNSFTAGVQISQGYVRADAEGCLGTGHIHIDKTVAGVSSTFGVVRQINFNADGAVFSNDILIEGKDPGASYHYTSSFIRTNVKT
ncbi:MAG: autotransporter-associated beta strand repeat-containing protein, partial [Kiritimatiellae bacterium]|nr:autotransporter-associated beta strand repeat-containing protein [Kiritimatiellia bacterium]